MLCSHAKVNTSCIFSDELARIQLAPVTFAPRTTRLDLMKRKKAAISVNESSLRGLVKSQPF